MRLAPNAKNLWIAGKFRGDAEVGIASQIPSITCCYVESTICCTTQYCGYWRGRPYHHHDIQGGGTANVTFHISECAQYLVVERIQSSFDTSGHSSVTYMCSLKTGYPPASPASLSRRDGHAPVSLASTRDNTEHYRSTPAYPSERTVFLS